MLDGIKNAKIEKTSLGRRDGFGMFFYIHLNYGDSSGQSFGDYMMDHPGKHGSPTRRPSCLTGACVDTLLSVFEIESWEALTGTYCRAIIENGLVKGIGHLLEDRWFRYDSLYRKLHPEVIREAEWIPSQTLWDATPDFAKIKEGQHV